MIGSSFVFSPISFNEWESKIDFVSGVIIMLKSICDLKVYLDICKHSHIFAGNAFSNGIHFRIANACDSDEYSGLSKIILAALFCMTRLL